MDKNKKIIALFKGDFTGFKRKFDCTSSVLKLSIEDLRSLSDHDHTSDSLASEELINEAKNLFTQDYGKESKNFEFGFEVQVEESIKEYFKVDALSSIRKCKLCSEFVGTPELREHLESHQPNSRGMSVNEVDALFEG